MVTGLQYGFLDIHRTDDEEQRFEIRQADPIILLLLDLLVQGGVVGTISATSDGHLLVCGQIRYRPVGFDPDWRGLVCQRIDD
jgi:hypothetical protein